MFQNSTEISSHYENSSLFEFLNKTNDNYLPEVLNNSDLYFNNDLNGTSILINHQFMNLTNCSEIKSSTDFISSLRAVYPVDEWLKLGYLTKDYLENINRHWFQFKPPSKQQHYLMASIYSAFMLCGVVGNSTVILLFFRSRPLRTPTNLLVLNLALSDLCMILKAPVFIFNSLHFGPALGQTGCSIYGVVGGITGVGSILSLCAIALDRYYAIAYPLNPRSRTTWGRALRWILILWIYSTCLAMAPLTGLARPYVPEGYLTSCSFDYLDEDQTTFIWIFFILGWVIPFVIIIFCYGGICRAVVGVGPSRVGQEKEKRKTEVRLALVVMLVVAVWFVAWTPYATVALLGITGYGSHITPIVSMLPALFCKTASCVDPFIYAFTHPRFRQELLRLTCGKRYDPRRQMTVQKTTVWRTDSENRRGNVREEDEGVEEMLVIIDNPRKQLKNRTSRPVLTEQSTSLESSDSISRIESLNSPGYKPPTWFVPPKKFNRSSSFN